MGVENNKKFKHITVFISMLKGHGNRYVEPDTLLIDDNGENLEYFEEVI